MSFDTIARNLTVVGAGTMGSQIMMQAAYHRKTVVGCDVSDTALDSLRARLDWMRPLYRQDLDGFTDEKFDQALARITTTTCVKTAMTDADLVIETVPENLELKREVWGSISTHDTGRALLATNSSYYLPSEIAPAVRRSERFGALHFAAMVWRANIGEVMGHAGTAPEVLDALARFGEDIGLRVFRLRTETRGYLLNSQLVPLLKQAARLYADGVGSFDDINESFKIGLALPTGVIEVFDRAGFGVFYESYADAKDPALREFARVMKRGIDNGKMGVGDGEGFYTYDRRGRRTGLGGQLPAVWQQ